MKIDLVNIIIYLDNRFNNFDLFLTRCAIENIS